MEPKGSASSSLDECPGFWAGRKHCFDHLSSRCCYCGAEQPAGEDDDKCTCGCTRVAHMDKPHGCLVHGFHDFVPAEPEAQPTGCIRDAGCRDIFHGCLGGCDAAQDDLVSLREDVESTEPECDGCGHAPHVADQCSGLTFGERCECDEPLARKCDHPKGCRFQDSGCVNMCAYEGMFKPESPALPCPEGGDCRRPVQCPDGCRRLTPEGPLASSPRPPFLVAYATGSGALNELALPGDVTAAVVDGSLVISHASGVLGIQYVKPLEQDN